MDISSMREMIRDVYNGYSWERRVDLMTDRQVYAVYMNMLKRGKFDTPKKKSVEDCCHQMTLFEYPLFNS